MSKRARRAFYLDGNSVIAETDVVRFAVGDDDQTLRSQVWTFFGSANKPDFYVTSSLIRADQKGSIHPTRAQFGYISQMWPPRGRNWMGVPPPSRHLETLIIPPLVKDEHLHVMTIRLPGIGLRMAGRPARRPKPLVLIPSYDAQTLITLHLVLYEGDWRRFVAPTPRQKAVAALENSNGRSLVVFLRKEREDDPVAFYNGLLKSLPVPSESTEWGDDLVLFATHQRLSDQPILITELHNIARPNRHDACSDHRCHR